MKDDLPSLALRLHSITLPFRFHVFAAVQDGRRIHVAIEREDPSEPFAVYTTAAGHVDSAGRTPAMKAGEFHATRKGALLDLATRGL